MGRRCIHQVRSPILARRPSAIVSGGGRCDTSWPDALLAATSAPSPSRPTGSAANTFTCSPDCRIVRAIATDGADRER
eukprot:283992-Prorocentrum_minimum.AAC.2